MEEEYELTPHSRLDALEKEVDQLKKHPIGSTKSGQNLLSAIETLNDSINRLIDIFKESAASMSPSEDLETPNNSVNKKIDELVNQNKEIAEALVNLADELNSHKEAVSDLHDKFDSNVSKMSMPPPVQTQMPAPMSRSQTQYSSMPSMPSMSSVSMPSMGNMPAYAQNPPSGPPSMTPMPKDDFDFGSGSFDSGFPDMPDFGKDLEMPGQSQSMGMPSAPPPPPSAPPRKKGMFGFGK